MLRVSVISPEAVLFEGDAESVVAPAYDGEVGILTGHAPLMALLGEGELRLGGAGGPRVVRPGGVLHGREGKGSRLTAPFLICVGADALSKRPGAMSEADVVTFC